MGVQPINADQNTTGIELVQKPDIRLLCAGSMRSLGVVDTPLVNPLEAPSIPALLSAVPDPSTISGLLLSGGEPTLRQDLPKLLEQLAEMEVPRLGLATDGLVLISEKAVDYLMKKGLKRVRIGFHSGRRDAHDWIVGLDGAAKRVHKAIKICVEAGLEVEVETIVTRPTVPYLEETVELLARLQVDSIIFRRLSGRNNAWDHFIAASPRFGPGEPFIKSALSLAEGWGIRTVLQHFPLCAANITDEEILIDGAEQWIAPQEGDWPQIIEHFEAPKRTAGCRDCPGDHRCTGAPVDYIQRFDMLELNSRSSLPTEKPALTEEEEDWATNRNSRTPPNPPPRAGRTPATRLSFVQKQHKRDLHGDPMTGVTSVELPHALAEAFLPDEHTRSIRIRLVRKSQEGVNTLRIVPPSLTHPNVGELLRDVTRLSFQNVEICGNGVGLKDVPDVDLRRLRRRVSRFDVAIYGPTAEINDGILNEPGHFEETMRTVGRLKSFARVSAGCYAIIDENTELEGFHEAWENETLPGTPQFRLSAEGGSLDTLATKVNALPDGATKNALSALLPCTVMENREGFAVAESWDSYHGSVLERAPHHPLDRIGAFNSCILREQCHEESLCPGVAKGWHSKEA